MIFLRQIGVVDSLTLAQFCIDLGSQYADCVLTSAANHMDDIKPSVFLLSPVERLGTSYKCVRTAQDAMERRTKIATVAAVIFL